jgi:hypothetical protein
MPVTEFCRDCPFRVCARPHVGNGLHVYLEYGGANEEPTILLVHGPWADSSTWNGVVGPLLKDRYDVRELPNMLRGVEVEMLP